jgi:hypothetical protein
MLTDVLRRLIENSTISRGAAWGCVMQNVFYVVCRSQWPCGLRRRCAASSLMRLWVRIPPREWLSVCCECCVLSGRGLCEELITRQEESYRLWCVIECDLETSSYTLYRYWIGVSGQIDSLTATSNVCQRVDFDPMEHDCSCRNFNFESLSDLLSVRYYSELNIFFFAIRCLLITESFYCKKLEKIIC